LSYRVGSAQVKERWSVKEGQLCRQLSLTGPKASVSFAKSDGGRQTLVAEPDGTTCEMNYAANGAQAAVSPAPKLDFKQKIVTKAVLGPAQAGYHVDSLTLPTENPWRRNIRPSGLDFLPDGRAAICTLDGDVWLVGGLDGDLAAVTWQRYATGLHEPQSIQAVGDRIFVFTKQGVEELMPAKDGSRAAAHRMLCDAFPHSADTREFPGDMVKRPGGGFFIAKGGQQLTRKGLSAGRIFAISADGQSVEEYARGLRQPYLGMDAKTGLLTATDQQGHWVPATPVHVISRGAYYGFPEGIVGQLPENVAQPALWFPHEVNQSAGGQVWCHSPAMGELNGSLVHLGFFKARMFKILLGKDQSAAVPLGIDFAIPLLKAAINPKDGLLYACGLQIWGTDAPKITGMIRLRPAQNQAPTLPTQITAHSDGVAIAFPFAIDPKSLTAENFTLQSWDYRRSKQYGSPPIAKDGKPGRNEHPITRFEFSADGKTLLAAAEQLQPSMTIQLDYTVAGANGTPVKNFAVVTAQSLIPADFAAKHPGGMTRKVEAKAAALADAKGDAAEGKKLVEMLGCLACHSTNGSMEGMKGPSWKGLLGSEVELVKGGDKAIVDRDYLTDSILHPANKVRRGFDNGDIGMPSYEGILTGSKLESVLLYLESLK
jgi:glucose/arabinose dehydrogenase/cytochrome c551/c552